MFKKIMQNYWENKSPEEKAEYLAKQEEKKRSILYCKDVDVHAKFKIDLCSIILRKDSDGILHFSIVDRHFKETGDREFWGYYFDKHFINKIKEADAEDRFMLDMGSDIYIVMKDMQEIIKDIEKKLNEKDIKLCSDYFPNIRPILKNTIFE